MFDILAALERSTTMLSVNQVADLFQVSARTIRRMITKKDIPSVIIGGQRRFDPATLRWWYIKKSPESQKARLAYTGGHYEG